MVPGRYPAPLLENTLPINEHLSIISFTYKETSMVNKCFNDLRLNSAGAKCTRGAPELRNEK